MIAPVPVAPASVAAVPAPAPAPETGNFRQSLIARPHTFLGVCEGIGEDLGFNPLYLRLAFAAGIFFAPMAVIATYLMLGLIVAASRWTFPVSSQVAPAVRADHSNDQAEELRIAA